MQVHALSAAQFEGDDAGEELLSSDAPTVTSTLHRVPGHTERLRATLRTPHSSSTTSETHPLPPRTQPVQAPGITPSCSAPLRFEDDALCTAATRNGDLIAVGYRGGAVDVYQSRSLGLSCSIPAAKPGAPASAVAFPGGGHSARGGPSNVLLVGCGDSLTRYHATTGKQLGETSIEEGNQVYCAAVCPSSDRSATAGTDHTLRVYDEASGRLSACLRGGDQMDVAGHSNRVHSVAWVGDDPSGNVIVSGGWDSTLQVWDLRLRHSVRSMHGAYVCGDAVDAAGGTVLSGSWRDGKAGDCLQLWDLGSGSLRTHLPLPWTPGDGVRLYAAKFVRGSGGTAVLCGGSGDRPGAAVVEVGGGVAGVMRTQSAVHAVTSSETGLVVACQRELSVVARPRP